MPSFSCRAGIRSGDLGCGRRQAWQQAPSPSFQLCALSRAQARRLSKQHSREAALSVQPLHCRCWLQHGSGRSGAAVRHAQHSTGPQAPCTPLHRPLDQSLHCSSTGVPACGRRAGPDEAGCSDRERFALELEFVQCLANPHYLNCAPLMGRPCTCSLRCAETFRSERERARRARAEPVL